MIRFILILLLPIVLSCTQLSAKDQPALLIKPTEKSREQVTDIVAQALMANKVFVSQSAFTQSNQLIIQRQSNILDGGAMLLSETELPQYFMLFKNSEGCFIKHRQSQREWSLNNVNCAVIDQKAPK